MPEHTRSACDSNPCSHVQPAVRRGQSRTQRISSSLCSSSHHQHPARHGLQARKNGTCPWLRPDGKTQVTVEYKNDGGAMIPQRVHTILISTQHSPDVDNDHIHKELLEHVIKPVVPAKYMDDKTIFHLNPSGGSMPTAAAAL